MISDRTIKKWRSGALLNWEAPEVTYINVVNMAHCILELTKEMADDRLLQKTKIEKRLADPHMEEEDYDTIT